MGKIYLEYLDIDGKGYYECGVCQTHFTKASDLISKNFHGKTGQAFLFNNAVNVFKGPEEEKVLMTGLHKVCDIHCRNCMKIVGWTYIYAHNQSEKYKEGKFIIEKAYIKHKSRNSSDKKLISGVASTHNESAALSMDEID
eukprot:403375541